MSDRVVLTDTPWGKVTPFVERYRVTFYINGSCPTKHGKTFDTLMEAHNFRATIPQDRYSPIYIQSI